jgi:iron complex outermembrane receptor protein
VNFITKKGDGGSLDAYMSQPGDSGGEIQRLSASWGKSFSRGNFRVTGDYYVNEELKMGDRDSLNCGQDVIFDPVTGERADVIDPRTGAPRCADLPWGHIWIYDYQDAGGNVPTRAKGQFDYDGDLGNYLSPITGIPGDPDSMRTPPGWYLVNYDRQTDGLYNLQHPFYDETSFIPKIERATFYGEGEFEVTDSMQLYAEALLNRRETTVNGYRQYWSYIYNEDFFAGNPLSAGFTGAQWFSPTPITDHSDSMIQVDYQRFVAGLRGDLTENWSYDISFQHSQSDGEYTNDRIYNDSITDQNWLSGSCVGMTTSVRGVPCIDIPWLDPELLRGNVSPEIREFLFGSETGKTEYTQQSVEAYVTGDLFELPAGTMAGAFGVHYREDEINDVPGPITLAGNGWGSSAAGITKGDDTTKAVFGELDIPLLAGQTGFEDLTLNISARYTDVDSYGADSTYKVGLNWQIVPAVKLRANRSTSFRTPALFELYLADQTSFLGQRFIDPCIQWGDELDAGNISQRVADNCAATTTDLNPNGLPADYTGGTITATIITGGGLGVLEAERSKSTTAGIVWTPEDVDFSLALDYFTITVNDQVDQLGPQAIVSGCYNSEFFPGDPLCNLFDRSSVNDGVDNVRDSFINVATQKNSGWDLSLRYVLDVNGGDLIFETQHTYQDEATTALFDDTVRDENGEFGNPKWVGLYNMRYAKNDWQFYYGIQYIGEVSNVESFGGDRSTYRGEDIRVKLEASSVLYNNASLAKDWDNGLSITAGISNLFDEKPPLVTTLGLGELNTQGTSPLYSQYDFYGRRAWLNLTYTIE